MTLVNFVTHGVPVLRQTNAYISSHSFVMHIDLLVTIKYSFFVLSLRATRAS